MVLPGIIQYNWTWQNLHHIPESQSRFPQRTSLQPIDLRCPKTARAAGLSPKLSASTLEQWTLPHRSRLRCPEAVERAAPRQVPGPEWRITQRTRDSACRDWHSLYVTWRSHPRHAFDWPRKPSV